MTSKRRWLNPLLATVAAVSVVASATLFFGAVDDSLVPGEASPIVTEFVRTVDADNPDDTTLARTTLNPEFGNPEGPASTLVLYDADSEYGEVQAIAAGNLASRFGRVRLEPMADYVAGEMTAYSGAIYIGHGDGAFIPQAFIDDVVITDTKVLWAGAGIEKLGWSPGFVESFGWDPVATAAAAREDITFIDYNGKSFEKPQQGSTVRVPVLSNPDKVTVLGTARCGDLREPMQCSRADSGVMPWAIRSHNLTYVGDIPVTATKERSNSIAFADLYYDLLAPDTQPTQKAAVRLEDVGPMAEPAHLRKVADLLYERGIPFQIAVIPFYVSKRTDIRADDRFVGLSLLDKPDVVDAIKYMQKRGGQIVQHGTTHQYGSLQNPYVSSRAGEDFEFVRSQCSATMQPPYEFEECKEESWVAVTGPVGTDTVDEHEERVRRGRDVLIEAGLGEPIAFEVPHYGSTPNAYLGIGRVFDTRYESVTYYNGLVSGKEPSMSKASLQIFPYSVYDIYGTKVLPENLGNVSPKMINNHPPRMPDDIIYNAELNLAVRESTASFFFHPYLDPAYLEDVVDGITQLGYEFVPATEL